jgi:putative redox protein
MRSTVTLTDGMAFDVELEGHHFPIDADAEFGGHDAGPRPKGLVLSALGGCAAMDIVSILRKMRQPLEGLAIHVEADKTETHPKTLVDFRVRVEATGAVDAKKLWRATQLSRDQYCGVAAMLRAHSPITYTVVLNGEEIPEPV